MIRDTLLQRGTPVALTSHAYLTTALAGAALTYLVRVEGTVWNRVWPLIDALALGCWSATGASRTLGVGLGWLPALMLGTITAVGGGAVRDVVLRKVPGVFGGNTLYATCALVASGVLVLVFRLGHPNVGLLAATATGAVLCLLARWRGWILPAADSWSPARYVPTPDSWARRLRGRRSKPDNEKEQPDER
jgi:uncharacterized membrane protein YeiH